MTHIFPEYKYFNNYFTPTKINSESLLVDQIVFSKKINLFLVLLFDRLLSSCRNTMSETTVLFDDSAANKTEQKKFLLGVTGAFGFVFANV